MATDSVCWWILTKQTSIKWERQNSEKKKPRTRLARRGFRLRSVDEIDTHHKRGQKTKNKKLRSQIAHRRCGFILQKSYPLQTRAKRQNKKLGPDANCVQAQPGGWGSWIRTSGMTESKSVALPLGDTPRYVKIATEKEMTPFLRFYWGG